jgi:hypothetical protein
MKFVTVKLSHYQTELVVLKSRLESEGIQCMLKNELSTQVLNHIPSFLVELQVPETDFEKGKAIMIEMGDWNSEVKQAACPSCGSIDVRMKLSALKRVKLFFAILYTGLVSTLPPDKLFRKIKFQCKDCHHEFY